MKFKTHVFMEVESNLTHFQKTANFYSIKNEKNRKRIQQMCNCSVRWPEPLSMLGTFWNKNIAKQIHFLKFKYSKL